MSMKNVYSCGFETKAKGHALLSQFVLRVYRSTWDQHLNKLGRYRVSDALYQISRFAVSRFWRRFSNAFQYIRAYSNYLNRLSLCQSQVAKYQRRSKSDKGLQKRRQLKILKTDRRRRMTTDHVYAIRSPGAHGCGKLKCWRWKDEKCRWTTYPVCPKRSPGPLAQGSYKIKLSIVSEFTTSVTHSS